ncbi:sensor histidine kinase [Vallitalea guaymasensis]|uniref:sensor histidine kinase n=1 Tax=Vallitalea guaymasensis TaxID=1185412 RepID=UPI000DE3B4AA|nr:HAMP domain-containing sensor histidine kinase [Vallitalea guaymasensis]
MRISVKHKLTIFIIFLLLINLVIISILTMNGIRTNQIKEYERYLKESSKTANLYIRERYLASDIEDFETFYIKQAYDLTIEIERVLGIHTIIFDNQGRQIGNEVFKELKNEYEDIITKALDNKIVYKKIVDKIIYAAPVYDFNGQIGVMQLEYNLYLQKSFNEDTWKLFVKFGLISIIVTFIIGRVFFINIVNRIKRLKKSVKLIEEGQYDISSVLIKSKDEFGELSTGIQAMSSQIQQNIKQLSDEKAKLQLALEHVQKLEKKQKEFIGNITHEFKTPITVIKAQIDLMNLYKDDNNLVDKSNIIVNNELKRLNQMVEKVLHLSSLEKYDFELEKHKIYTHVLLKEIIDKLKGKASKYGIEFYYQLEPCQVYMDRESFMMIFINLMDNAIKYNVSNGKIKVTSTVKKGVNRIEIADTGIGIPDEHKKRVFEPFYTVDKNKSKKLSGTGLGLSLVKKMLEKQNATICILDSDIGTVFQVNIPLSQK